MAATRTSLVLSLLCLHVIVGCVVRYSCPQDWFYFQNSCYGFGELAVTWGDAQAICKAFNGRLAEIESEAENTFLKNITRNRRAAATWLGGTDIFHEGNWVWPSNGHQIQPFLDWASSEPDDAHGQDCLCFYKGYDNHWGDCTCSELYNFLCEAPSQEKY